MIATGLPRQSELQEGDDLRYNVLGSKMKNIRNYKWFLVLFVLISLVCNAEADLYSDLTDRVELTDQQFQEYLDSLTPHQLLLLDKQVCQHWEETGEVDDRLLLLGGQHWEDEETGELYNVGQSFFMFQIMAVYVRKMDEKPDVSQLFSMMNDKGECLAWRCVIIQWIMSAGHKYLSGEEQNQLSQYLENLIEDKTDSPSVRSLSILFLNNSTYVSYKQAVKMKTRDLAVIEEHVWRNVLTLSNILQDFSEDSEVTMRAIMYLGRYWKLNTRVSAKVRESLLQAFENRKQYVPECQVALASVLVVPIGDTSIVSELHKMRDEIEDKRLKDSIEDLLLTINELER